jgi:hypothetical protein
MLKNTGNGNQKCEVKFVNQKKKKKSEKNLYINRQMRGGFHTQYNDNKNKDGN